MPKLPDNYIDRMRNLLGDDFDDYLHSFEQKSYRGIRINPTRISKDDFLSLIDNSRDNSSLCYGKINALSPVPWCQDGFYVEDDECNISSLVEYYQGLFYIQEPSAMSPASYLPVSKEDIVLDLCAAPGGKATYLASRCKFLIANDISATRANALLKNLDNAGAVNFAVTAEKPSKLSTVYSDYFDKILVDAPCSGEGMFRKHPHLIDSWLEHGPEYYHEIQMEILSDAYKMLKCGGLMMYSTCTFAMQEDEETIKWFLDNYPDMELIDIDNLDASFERGYGDACKKCVRLFPHRIKGEGHFLALLRKKSKDDKLTRQVIDDVSENKVFYRKYTLEFNELYESLGVSDSFFDRLFSIIGSYKIRVLKDKAVLEADCLNVYKGIRYLRTGLLLGEIKNNKLIPSQALCMALKRDEYNCVLNLSSVDDRALRYIKGETIIVDEDELTFDKPVKSGSIVLLCYNGYSLGFGKYINGRIKNMYPKSWVKIS